MRIVLIGAMAVSRRHGRHSAATLPEMMITLLIFSMSMAALVYTHLFGLKQEGLVQSKLGASDHARKSFGVLARDIRSAAEHAVGNYSGGVFTPIGNGTNQVGNAIQICLGTNAAAYTRLIYYFDTSLGTNNRLMRKRGNGAPREIASHLTNSLTFTAETFDGNVANDISDRNVIRFTLDFLQYQYPLTKVGPGGGYLYDRYKMDFRVAPHVPEGR